MKMSQKRVSVASRLTPCVAMEYGLFAIFDDMLCHGKVSVPPVRYLAYKLYPNMDWNLSLHIYCIL